MKEREVIVEEEWVIMGVMDSGWCYDGEWKVVGSYSPQKKDDQRMWVTGKLGPTGSYFQGGKLGYPGSRNPMGHTGRWEIQKKAHLTNSQSPL